MASIPDMSAHGQLTINDIYGTGAWLTYALIAACFASLLVPLLVVLLVFSTNDLRRSLIFYLNVLALFMGIGEGVTLAYLNVYNIFFPEDNNSTIPGPVLSWLLFSFWSPMLVEGILYLRLWAVFPPTLVSRNTRVVILGIPILSKGARCAVLGYATFEWVRSASMIGTFLAGLQFWPMARVVWCLQLFDNIYMSTLFIYQLRSQMNTGPILGLKLNSFTDRARTLFMISISNFVVPCIFCTAQIVIASVDIQATNLSLFLFSTYLAVANNYVTILGVVFATVWSAGSRWMEHGGDSNDLGQLSQPVSIPSCHLPRLFIAKITLQGNHQCAWGVKRT
ncbi:hypothetical protein ONZ45_g14503 [Pleurotus djamor]|nr:hypothetical protein ONZ45_g14503 [Pleurotus djamor]